MSECLRKGEWALSYDDGSEKVVVSFNTASEHCPTHIKIEYSSDQWVMVDAEDAPWIAARLLDAAAAIEKANQCALQAIDAARAALDACGWRDAKANPPANGETVLAVWLWNAHDRECGSQSHEVVTYDCGQWTDSCGSPTHDPSHYMPLPSPPSEQEEG